MLQHILVPFYSAQVVTAMSAEQIQQLGAVVKNYNTTNPNRGTVREILLSRNHNSANVFFYNENENDIILNLTLDEKFWDKENSIINVIVVIDPIANVNLTFDNKLNGDYDYNQFVKDVLAKTSIENEEVFKQYCDEVVKLLSKTHGATKDFTAKLRGDTIIQLTHFDDEPEEFPGVVSTTHVNYDNVAEIVHGEYQKVASQVEKVFKDYSDILLVDDSVFAEYSSQLAVGGGFLLDKEEEKTMFLSFSVDLTGLDPHIRCYYSIENGSYKIYGFDQSKPLPLHKVTSFDSLTEFFATDDNNEELIKLMKHLGERHNKFFMDLLATLFLPNYRYLTNNANKYECIRFSKEA